MSNIIDVQFPAFIIDNNGDVIKESHYGDPPGFLVVNNYRFNNIAGALEHNIAEALEQFDTWAKELEESHYGDPPGFLVVNIYRFNSIAEVLQQFDTWAKEEKRIYVHGLESIDSTSIDGVFMKSWELKACAFKPTVAEPILQ